MKMIKKIKFEHIRLFIYFLSVVLIFFVVIGKVNIGCYYKDNYNIICPACGLTRATISILKLDFVSAYKYNSFYTIVLLPLVLILIINDIYVILKRKCTKVNEFSLVEILLGEGKKWI